MALQTAFILYELAWYALFVIALHDALRRWGNARTATFFIPAIAWGFLLEWSAQSVFARYHYGEGFFLYALNVPLNISLAWAALLYCAYVAIPKRTNVKSTAAVALVAALALILVDVLVFEPLAYTFGYWTWTPQGLWFGSPLGNVYGWFWVTVLFLGAFQWIDRQTWDTKSKFGAMLACIPALTILLTGLLQLYEAVLGKL